MRRNHCRRRTSRINSTVALQLVRSACEGGSKTCSANSTARKSSSLEHVNELSGANPATEKLVTRNRCKITLVAFLGRRNTLNTIADLAADRSSIGRSIPFDLLLLHAAPLNPADRTNAELTGALWDVYLPNVVKKHFPDKIVCARLV